jgi:hypothetical protein
MGGGEPRHFEGELAAVVGGEDVDERAAEASALEDLRVEVDGDFKLVAGAFVVLHGEVGGAQVGVEERVLAVDLDRALIVRDGLARVAGDGFDRAEIVPAFRVFLAERDAVTEVDPGESRLAEFEFGDTDAVVE